MKYQKRLQKFDAEVKLGMEYAEKNIWHFAYFVIEKTNGGFDYSTNSMFVKFYRYMLAIKTIENSLNKKCKL